MAAVQHEPVAEKVVQFLPAPPPPPPSPLVPPPSQLSEQLTYPSSWPLHCRHGGVFFFFLFPPLLQPANKSLALSPGFFSLSLLLAHAFSYKHTHSFPFKQSFSLTLPGAVCPPLPSLSPRLPPLLLPGQLFSSGSARVLEPFVSSSPSGQGSRGAHGSSLSLTHPHPRLSLHTVMREQLCGR